METLIIVGHGQHDQDYRLDANGYWGISNLAKKLKNFLPDGEEKSISIITAPYFYTLSTANIIKETFTENLSEIEEVGELMWTERNFNENYFINTLEIIKSKEKDVIVVIPSTVQHLKKFINLFIENEKENLVHLSKLRNEVYCEEAFLINYKDQSSIHVE